MPKSAPERSCIACRTQREKQELLRFVLSPAGELVPDLQQKLPGRGAYTCLNAACVRQAVARRQFARGFKTQVAAADGDALVALLLRQMAERLAGYLALANKAGQVLSGSDQVLGALKGNQRPGLVIVAGDLSADSRERVAAAARTAGATLLELFDKERLGELLGKELRGVVAVRGSGFVTALERESERLRNFLTEGR